MKIAFLLAALALAGLRVGARRAAGSLRAPTRREVLWGTLAVGALGSIVAAYRIATLQLILGSSEGHQIYQYVEEFAPRSLPVALGAAIIGWLLGVTTSVVFRFRTRRT